MTSTLPFSLTHRLSFLFFFSSLHFPVFRFRKPQKHTNFAYTKVVRSFRFVLLFHPRHLRTVS